MEDYPELVESMVEEILGEVGRIYEAAISAALSSIHHGYVQVARIGVAGLSG